MAASYDFVQLDVFTQTPLAGNPLAVFTDARGLTDKQMQALAREMNLSETTFILPREPSVEAREGKRVRIFTVEEELPFAGHPTIGTALYIYSTASSGTNQVVLDLNVGKIPVSFRVDSEKAGRDHANGQVFGQMQQRDPEFGPILSREKIAEELGLNVDDLDPERAIQIVSTGFPFAIVPFRNSKRLARFQPDITKARRLLDGTEARFFYFICPERMENRDVRARMFFYGGEDPATGSAAGCAAAWMAKYGIAKSDERILIRQGVEAGRPSEIFVSAKCEGDRVTNVRVGGYAVELLRGTVTL
jgi:trans-2,3-dihydro-3-hydroxyanthranilate isomerase